MRTGQIIRKKLESGTPIGPWLQIIAICGNEICVRIVGLQTATNKIDMISRNQVYEPQSITVSVNTKILRRINAGFQSAIDHPVMKRWKEENYLAEVVKIYDYSGKASWFTVERLLQTYNTAERKNYVRIVLGQKLLQI